MSKRLLKREVTQQQSGKYSGTEYFFDTVTKAASSLAVYDLDYDASFSRPTTEDVMAVFRVEAGVSYVDVWRHDGNGGVSPVVALDWYTYTVANDKLRWTLNHTAPGGRGSIEAWTAYADEAGQVFTLYKMPAGSQVANSMPFGVYEWTFQNLLPGEYKLERRGDNNTLEEELITILEIAPGTSGPGPQAPDVPLPVMQELYFSQNPIPFTYGALSPNTSVVVELYMETRHLEGDFRKVAEMEREADGLAVAEFNLADVVNTRLAAAQEPGFPVLGAAIQHLRQNLSRFYLRVAERSATGTLAGWQRTNTANVIFGGIPQHVYMDTFLEYQRFHRRFFTWQPAGKKLYEGHHELLHFLVEQKEETQIIANTEFLAGASPVPVSSITSSIDLTGFEGEYKLLSVPVKATGWNAGATRLRVTMQDSLGNALSESRYFDLERQPEQVRTFLFRTSLGVYEVLTATGERSDTLEIEEELAENTQGERFSFFLEGRQSFKVSTGYKSRPYLEYLQEFILSRHKAELIGERAQPITVSTKKLDYRADNVGPQGFQFEYSHATLSNHYATL